MEKITAILKGTHGVFLSALSCSNPVINDNAHAEYIDVAKDKENLRNDMLNLFSDFRKATNEAKIKIAAFI